MEIASSLFENSTYQATKAMLDVAMVKHQAFAANIANSSTPGYQRVQANKTFEQELQGRLKSGQPLNLGEARPAIEKDSSAISTKMDGNTVELDQELLQMSSNSTNYQVLTQFLNGSFRQLRIAITGKSV
jgi:flagellar basal-body rod protein FlgB